MLFQACTQTTRLEQHEYTVLTAIPREPLEIHTRDGFKFIARKTATSDSTITILEGEVTEPGESTKSAMQDSVIVPLSSIESVYKHQIDQDTTLIVVLGGVLLAIGIAALAAVPGGL